MYTARQRVGRKKSIMQSPGTIFIQSRFDLFQMKSRFLGWKKLEWVLHVVFISLIERKECLLSQNGLLGIMPKSTYLINFQDSMQRPDLYYPPG